MYLCLVPLVAHLVRFTRTALCKNKTWRKYTSQNTSERSVRLREGRQMSVHLCFWEGAAVGSCRGGVKKNAGDNWRSQGGSQVFSCIFAMPNEELNSNPRIFKITGYSQSCDVESFQQLYECRLCQTEGIPKSIPQKSRLPTCFLGQFATHLGELPKLLLMYKIPAPPRMMIIPLFIGF